MKRGIVTAPYITGFVAIAGITAGIAAKMDTERLKESFFALGSLDGGELLKLALLGIVLDMMLCFAACVFNARKLQSMFIAACIWFKMYIMGCFIKSSFGALPLIAAILLTMLTLLGGIAVCGAMLMRHYEKAGEKAGRTVSMSLYLFVAGIMAEGIIMPSVARMLSLLVN